MYHVVPRKGGACKVGVKYLVMVLSAGCVPISVIASRLSVLLGMQHLDAFLDTLPHLYNTKIMY